MNEIHNLPPQRKTYFLRILDLNKRFHKKKTAPSPRAGKLNICPMVRGKCVAIMRWLCSILRNSMQKRNPKTHIKNSPDSLPKVHSHLEERLKAPRQVCRHSKNFLIKKIPHSDEKGDECSGNNGNIEEAQPGKSWDLAPYTVAKKHQCQGDGYNGSVASQPPFPNAEKFP